MTKRMSTNITSAVIYRRAIARCSILFENVIIHKKSHKKVVHSSTYVVYILPFTITLNRPVGPQDCISI